MPYQEKHQNLMSTEMNDCTVLMAYDWSRLSSKLHASLQYVTVKRREDKTVLHLTSCIAVRCGYVDL